MLYKKKQRKKKQKKNCDLLPMGSLFLLGLNSAPSFSLFPLTDQPWEGKKKGGGNIGRLPGNRLVGSQP